MEHIWDPALTFIIDRSEGRTVIAGCRNCLARKVTFMHFYNKKRLPDGFKEILLEDPLTGACRDERD